MAKWYNILSSDKEKQNTEYFYKNKSIRAYELFKKNKFISELHQDRNEQIQWDSSTNRTKSKL